MILYFLFCICYPIFLYGVLGDIICLINTDSVLTLDDVNVEDNWFLVLLGSYITFCVALRMSSVSTARNYL